MTKLSPKPFQVDGIKFIRDHLRSVLADEMGLGKTAQGLWGAIYNRICVICPASVKPQFATEVERFTNLTPVICNGIGSFRWAEEGEVVIANPESIPDWINKPRHPMTMLIDEAHTYRNSNSRKYQNGLNCFRQLTPDSQVVAMTGTPLVNTLTDLANLLDIIGILEPKFGGREGLADMMGGSVGKRGDLRNCEVNSRVTSLLADVMIRRVKADVMDDLPTKKYKVVKVNRWSRSLQDQMDEGLASIDAYEALNGPIRSGSLPPITELARARKAMAVEKTEYVEPLIDELSREGQVVFFSAHRDPVEYFGKQEGWGMITGSQSVKARQKAAEAFCRKDTRGIALTIGAGNCGLNLQSANRMVFLDLDYQLGSNLQAEDRIHRLGQQADSCEYSFVTLDHPLDRRMGQILSGKKTLFDAVCDPVTRN